MAIPQEILDYHAAQAPEDRAICERLAEEIEAALPGAERKIWHRHPVWFLDGNPIVGYSRSKAHMQLLFWSGQSFTAAGLIPEGKFKAAEARYNTVGDIDISALRRWLEEAHTMQWDYKNLVKRKGKLERLK